PRRETRRVPRPRPRHRGARGRVALRFRPAGARRRGRDALPPARARGAVGVPGTASAGAHVSIAREAKQRLTVGAYPELPRDPVGRRAPRADAICVNAVQMVPGTDGDAVVARVLAAARAEEDVMVVQIPP